MTRYLVQNANTFSMYYFMYLLASPVNSSVVYTIRPSPNQYQEECTTFPWPFSFTHHWHYPLFWIFIIITLDKQAQRYTSFGSDGFHQGSIS